MERGASTTNCNFTNITDLKITNGLSPQFASLLEA